MESTSAPRSSTPVPSDAGAVAARQGFKYQDHVAAHFVLLMLTDARLLQVECETADDIVLVWSDGTSNRPEYVQVKTTEDDKKWSLKEVCEREDPKRPTSLIEKSLLCDCRGPNALFRIVSRRAVAKALACLTLPLEKRTNLPDVFDLADKASKRHKTTKSKNGNDLGYWVTNALWQVMGELDALEAKNQRKLAEIAEQRGVNPTHRHLLDIYKELLSILDAAASASRSISPESKVITRNQALAWLKNHLDQTEAAVRKASKPYRVETEGFLAELHHISEDDIRRALTGYDVSYELRRWRSKQLAEYLANWLPELALKASELVQVQHLNMRQKLRTAVKTIKRERDINEERLLAELLLHAVLRHLFKSEPIACKIFYHTASGAKAFGNAHIVHGERDELWLGRATLATATSYDAVLASIINEINNGLDPDFLKEEREVILTLREPQHLLPTTLDEALKHNTPIDDLLSVLCIPILIAYDSAVLAGGFTENYRLRLIQEIKTHYKEIKATLPTGSLALKVHVFLVPAESIDTLIQHFAEELRGI